MSKYPSRVTLGDSMAEFPHQWNALLDKVEELEQRVFATRIGSAGLGLAIIVVAWKSDL